MRDTLPFRGGEINLFPSGVQDGDAPLVCLLCARGEGPAVRDAALEAGAGPFHMAAVPVADWNADLSPWPAPGLRGGEAFGGRADAFLKELEAALPGLRAALRAPDAPCYIAGYSLAGLFSVWALYRTAAFDGAASVSGSLWYPDFAGFLKSGRPQRKPRRVYLSLGDRESRTRDPLLRRTEDETRALCAALREMGTESVFELNPGGHFQDAEKRMARGVAWIAGIDNK